MKCLKLAIRYISCIWLNITERTEPHMLEWKKPIIRQTFCTKNPGKTQNLEMLDTLKTRAQGVAEKGELIWNMYWISSVLMAPTYSSTARDSSLDLAGHRDGFFFHESLDSLGCKWGKTLDWKSSQTLPNSCYPNTVSWAWNSKAGDGWNAFRSKKHI